MTAVVRHNDLGRGLPIGAHHHRAFIGSAEMYDVMSASQFNLLTTLGLREHHFLLDIGCGSLRAGRLFIAYLLKGHYFGIEPEAWLIQEGIARELGEDLIHLKQPVFSHDDNFTLTTFDQPFDYLLAHSIFSHASQRQIRRCLSQAQQVMKPGAIFAATFFEGSQNYTGDKWIYPGVATYTPDHFSRLVEEQGLACRRIEWPHENKQTWIVIVHPDNVRNIPNLSSAARQKYLETELRHCQQKLSDIEHHPYVKLGLWVHRWVHRLKWRL